MKIKDLMFKKGDIIYVCPIDRLLEDVVWKSVIQNIEKSKRRPYYIKVHIGDEMSGPYNEVVIQDDCCNDKYIIGKSSWNEYSPLIRIYKDIHTAYTDKIRVIKDEIEELNELAMVYSKMLKKTHNNLDKGETI